MTPTWTGRPGSPAPVALRHDFGDGRRCGTCRACGAVWVIVEGYDVSLCGVAVAHRLADLEAHEASLHKHAARVRDEIERWLRRDLDRLWAAMQDSRLTDGRVLFLQGQRVALALAADAIARGDDAEWCEANPEIQPAREGADAGRDPGREE